MLPTVWKKELSVITKIGFDHMEYLGDTLTQIAAEKAGILKENTPVVYYAGREEVNETIEKEAEKSGARPSRFCQSAMLFTKIRIKTLIFLFTVGIMVILDLVCQAERGIRRRMP